MKKLILLLILILSGIQTVKAECDLIFSRDSVYYIAFCPDGISWLNVPDEMGEIGEDNSMDFILPSDAAYASTKLWNFYSSIKEKGSTTEFFELFIFSRDSIDGKLKAAHIIKQHGEIKHLYLIDREELFSLILNFSHYIQEHNLK